MAEICVFGLGYVGLPTASLLASGGFQVLGVDIDPVVVQALNNGETNMKEAGLASMVSEAVRSGNLVAAAVPEPSDIFIICVPTPTTVDQRVDLDAVKSVTRSIAGLLQQSVQAIVSKIPGLGDLPVLGTLFSSTDYKQSNTELVVLVTPQLIEPLEPHQVAPPPGSLMTHPTDLELFTLQRLEGTPLEKPEYDGVPRDLYPVRTRPGSRLQLAGPRGLAE